MFDCDARPAGETEPQNNNSQTDPASMGFPTRYREKAMSWIALGALLAAWHMPARVDRPKDEPGQWRISAPRSAQQREPKQPWLTRAADVRPWIARAPHGVARSRLQLRVEQPEWSALASVRTARRWLGSL